MLDQRRQYGKHRLFITSIRAGERNLFWRDPSVGCLAASNPSLMKLMKNLYETIAPFSKTSYCSSPKPNITSLCQLPI